jgi:hypothetical protein
MKKKSFFKCIIIGGVSLIMFSCAQSKFVVAPPFTDVEKITKLEVGQSKEKVNEVLGITPYDILYLNDGNVVYFFNYRLLDRKIGVDNSRENIEKNAKTLSSKESQTKGDSFYSHWKRLYICFKNNTLTNFISDTGLEDANYLELVNGTIKLLNSKNLELNNFYEPSNVIISNPSASNVSNSLENKSLDIEKLLFPLDKHGKFLKTENLRKRESSFLPKKEKK